MNNFEAKYIILSSKYLEEKLEEVKNRRTYLDKKEVPEKSKLRKIVSNFFKSTIKE